ncbi:MAG: HAD family hydrolase, partial [Candidatus Omnitrophica bacterium]|nr:HAD family hydrolase [Candidatus Omnitrophota bacterium]
MYRVIVKELDFIRDKDWGIYLKNIEADRGKILTNEKKIRYRDLLEEEFRKRGWLDKDDRLNDVGLIYKINKKFFSSFPGAHLAFLQAKNHGEIKVVKGVSLYRFIVKELNFIKDKDWETYLRDANKGEGRVKVCTLTGLPLSLEAISSRGNGSVRKTDIRHSEHKGPVGYSDKGNLYHRGINGVRIVIDDLKGFAAVKKADLDRLDNPRLISFVKKERTKIVVYPGKNLVYFGLAHLALGDEVIRHYGPLAKVPCFSLILVWTTIEGQNDKRAFFAREVDSDNIAAQWPVLFAALKLLANLGVDSIWPEHLEGKFAASYLREYDSIKIAGQQASPDSNDKLGRSGKTKKRENSKIRPGDSYRGTSSSPVKDVLRAVIFDLEGTLYDVAPELDRLIKDASLEIIAKKVSRFKKRHVGKKEADELFEKKAAVQEGIYGYRQSATHVMGRSFGIDVWKWNRYKNKKVPMETVRQFVRPDAEAIRVLEEISRLGIVLAIATNNNRKMAEWTLDALGQRRFFKPHLILAADQIGSPKPNRTIYRKLQRRIEEELGMGQRTLSAASVAVVGDNKVTDLDPAKEIGMHTLLRCSKEDVYTLPGYIRTNFRLQKEASSPIIQGRSSGYKTACEFKEALERTSSPVKRDPADKKSGTGPVNYGQWEKRADHHAGKKKNFRKKDIRVTIPIQYGSALLSFCRKDEMPLLRGAVWEVDFFDKPWGEQFPVRDDKA